MGWRAACAGGPAAPGGEDVLGLAEDVSADDRGMHDLVGVDPVTGLVPPHLRGVAQGDVVNVQEHFVLALLVPDLPAGVAGVDEDGADGALGPGNSAAVLVAARVVRGRAGDAVTGQALGDSEQSLAGDELAEDPRDHGRGRVVKGQECSRLPSAALAGLGCGPASISGTRRAGVRRGSGLRAGLARPWRCGRGS